MENILRIKTLENKFPLLAIENNYIISKNADLTAAFRVVLPELFTITPDDYKTIHTTWLKAVKVLPDYTIVHKQDWFIREDYRPELKEYKSFLSRSYELHFNERPYLHHYCYLFLTKTTKEQSRRQSNFSTLSRGFIIPKEVNPETYSRFNEAVEQFLKIVNDSGLLTLYRLSDEEITGSRECAGLIEKYLTLTHRDKTVLQDIGLYPSGLHIGDNRICLHTLSDVNELPGNVATDTCYERLSTEQTACKLSFASPVGLLLSCNHIYNQYIFLDHSGENLKLFEKRAKNMKSLSRYSRANQINREWAEMYLNEAHAKGLMSIRAHYNICAWADNEPEFRQIKNQCGSQIALMGCKPHYNVTDAPVLFWAGIPGNSGDFPSEESFYTFPEQALCFLTNESNYRNSASPFGIKLGDRLSGKPLWIDISDLPMKMGYTTNRNKFILGGSGSGKSFFTNHMVRQYYEQQSHILIVDTGNSYWGLCTLINEQTKGEDGIYFTYTEENPIAFNPFYTDDKVFDIEKRESIKTLILTLWKKDTEPATRADETNLSNSVNLYIKKIQSDEQITPCFNTYYEFLQTEYREILQQTQVREKEFDLLNLLNILAPYYRGGEYDYLLNSTAEIDLLHKRFVVFELDNIKDHPILFPVVTLIIMESFINKMRRLKGIRKVLIIEEAWKAIAKAGMAEYIRYLFKTVRKYYGEVCVVSQEVEDIISSPIVKESIINNSDCKILLDQRKYLNKFTPIQQLLGLTDKEKAQILSLNMANRPDRIYKEVFISLGGMHSAVYAVEVSKEEYYIYTTEEKEKMRVMELVKQTGSLQLAVKQLAIG